MAAQAAGQEKLSQLFLRGWEARRKLDACELATGSPDHSACVAEGTAALERATELASHAGLFSDNEDLDEVATSSLKYLLLPSLLGELTLQKTEGERMDTVLKARVYFVDYLKRCQCYGVTKDDPPPLNPPSPPGVGGASGEQPRKTYDQMAAERAAKIQRLREKKELERRTEELTAVLDRGRGCGGGEEEEEEEEEAGGREQWVAMLQLNVYRSREFVKSIEDEIPILRHMETLRKGEGPPVAKRLEASGCGPPRQPAKPIVITREMLRGEVFGAGYPSVPTMTVEEFYQQRYGGGGGGAKRDDDRSGVKEEEEEKEDEEEDDSEEAVKKAREWDEFKDDNRRGWGNKKNMG